MYGAGERKTFGTGEALDDIVKRAALNIHCRWSPRVGFIVAGPHGATWLEAEREVATAAYLALVATLTPPTASPDVCVLPDRAGPATGIASPDPMPVAISSPSAVPSADDAPSRRVCGDVSPGIAAPISAAP